MTNIIFGTTNERKKKDMQLLVDELALDVNVLSMEDIGWDLGEIEENGDSCLANAMIKLNAISEFCKNKQINCAIITDDSGLFVNALNGRPGIYTARYAEEEKKNNPSLPKSYDVIKMVNEMDGVVDRSAYYLSQVACKLPNGEVVTTTGKTYGTIAYAPVEPIAKPYLYSLFIDNKTNKTLNILSNEEIKNTYRYEALKELFKKYYRQMIDDCSKTIK